MSKLLGAMALGLVVMTQPLSAGPASMTLRDGFDGTDFAENGGLYYRDNHEQAAGTVEFQSDLKRSGTGALRLSVKSLCTPEAERCSERAEIWEKTALRVPYDVGVWYGFSVKFADPIPQDDHRYLIAQWKREIGPDAEGDFSPFLAFRVTEGKLFVTVETNFYQPTSPPQGHVLAQCAAGQTPVWLRPETNQMRLLVTADPHFTKDDAPQFNACTDRTVVTNRGNPLPSPGDGWADFAIYSHPGPDGTGHIELFANGKWIATVRGYIGHNDMGLEKDQYFKFGPYRDGAPDVWTMYYDNFVRSPSCEDVLKDHTACAALAE